MTRIFLRTRVSRDGMLHLSLPVGLAEADQEVQIIVEAVTRTEPMTQETWRAWVDSMAGTWQGDFGPASSDAQSPVR